MATVRYRNKKTGSVAVYASTISRLERSDDWEREPENDKPFPSAPKKRTRKKAADDSAGDTGAESGSGETED